MTLRSHSNFSKSRKSVMSSKKKKKMKKRNPIFQFKALVRMVMYDAHWLSDTTDVPLGENAEQNAYILTHKKDGKQLLALADKLVFKKALDARTKEEIDTINRKLGLFKAFRNYPEKIKKELLLRADYECYGKGRVIVRQGQQAAAVYFIVEGTVEFDHAYPDPIFPDEVVHNIDVYNEGDGFGELPLLYNEAHSGTVTVTSNFVELLVLKKEDFSSVLETSVQRQWNAVRWALKKFQYFDQFPESGVRLLCSFSSLTTYRPNHIIPMKDDTGTDIVTFIVDGTCKVIQVILVSEDRTKTKMEQRFRLSTKRISMIDALPASLTPIFMQTCTLRRKCVFGLGDEMSKENLIITKNEVLALVVPRYLLMRYNIANVWARAVGILDLNYPKVEEVFRAFIENRKWIQYKHQLVKSLRGRHGKREMSIHDTPLTVRAKSLRMTPKLYKKVVSMPEYKFGELDLDETLEILKESRQRLKNKLMIAEKQNQRKMAKEEIEERKFQYARKFKSMQISHDELVEAMRSTEGF